MARLTTDQATLAGARLDGGIPPLPWAVAQRLPALHPLDVGHTVIDVRAETQPTRHDLLVGDQAVGTLLTTDWPYATAVCSHGVWRLTIERRGLLSRIGIAHDAITGHAVAAYYPRVRPGGTIALHDTGFYLKLPWRSSGWWLFDENDRPSATFVTACTGAGCRIRNWTLRLQQPGRELHPDMALVLLTAVWVIQTFSIDLLFTT